MRCADGLFGTVVEVVAEGRPNLALQFDRGNEFALVQEVNRDYGLAVFSVASLFCIVICFR